MSVTLGKSEAICLDSSTLGRAETNHPQHPQWILAEALFSRADGPEKVGLKIGYSSERVDETPAGDIVADRIYRKIAQGEIGFDRLSEDVLVLRPEGRELDMAALDHHHDRAVFQTGIDSMQSRPLKPFSGDLRGKLRGEVDINGWGVEQGIPNSSADQVSLRISTERREDRGEVRVMAHGAKVRPGRVCTNQTR
jgi:hypothetical protein